VREECRFEIRPNRASGKQSETLPSPLKALRVSDALDTGNGAPGRSRTDTLLKAVDFLATSALAAA